MRKPEELLEMALEQIRKGRNLKGEFIVRTQYEQGLLPIQKCSTLSVYYKEGPRTIILYRWRACSANSDEGNNEEAFVNTLSYIIVQWEEIWNLINTKPQ